MKKKNGFTLIELIAVVTLLAVIILVSVPVIINTLSNTEEKEYEDFKKLVTNAAELYIERNRDLYPELNEIGEVIEITSDILVNEGYLKSSLQNPINNNPASNYKILVVVNQDGIFDYEIYERNNLVDLATISKNNDVKMIDKCSVNNKCDAGTAFAIKVNDADLYKFYVISDDGNKVILIMSENLGSEVAWIDENDYHNKAGKCTGSVCNEEGPVTAINYLDSITKNEWTNIPLRKYTYAGSGLYGSYNITKIMKARMLTQAEANLKEIGCGPSAYSCPEWIYGGKSYWLSSVHTQYSNSARFVAITGYWANSSVDSSHIGVRPVIEISRY